MGGIVARRDRGVNGIAISSAAIGFAGDAVVVPVHVLAIARLPSVKRRGTRCACRSAVGIRPGGLNGGSGPGRSVRC